MSKTALLALAILTLLSAQLVPGTGEARKIETLNCEAPDKADRKGCNDKCDGVVCPAGDGICDGGQICDSATGSCVDLADPPVGTPCELGNLCQDEVCDGSGTCVPTEGGVFCGDAGGQCSGREGCNPDTGACEPLPPEPDGTPCNEDDDLCTVDVCTAGVCVMQSAITCAPGDGVCMGAEVCDSFRGICQPNPIGPGTPCNTDNDLCTIDVCNGSGSCVNNGDVNCTDPNCETCDPTTGMCQDNPAMCAGFECGDDACGLSCGTCTGGLVCDGSPGLCAPE